MKWRRGATDRETQIATDRRREDSCGAHLSLSLCRTTGARVPPREEIEEEEGAEAGAKRAHETRNGYIALVCVSECECVIEIEID